MLAVSSTAMLLYASLSKDIYMIITDVYQYLVQGIRGDSSVSNTIIVNN